MKSSALLAALFALPAIAHEYAAGELVIGHPHALATAPGAPVGGGYLSIRNDGAADDALVAVRVDPGIAGRAELHEMALQGDVMLMRQIEDGIPVPAGTTVELAPGGLHIMLMHLPGPLKEGTDFPATLVFEKAGEVEVRFEVEARGRGRDGAMDHGPDGAGSALHGKTSEAGAGH